ncbi:AraC family transcriptional regulator [Bradyrhizobium sp. UFLA03-84]|uniref:AraC family transcriptional regulator n=1 Tax=Bradyrhizobium sp. UFLA03-84 TaxID=418599 RepID=UPI000BADE76A|nr:helix-turn-helix domain-containing protein [Bradyrhizobium sp. UFLA03-84]PAY04967.1 AraC family transcriptional regulator [Bradyrhizobium sp. UFLA03-84]
MTNAWNYRRADRDDIVELASWRGAGSLGLRPHFHDESQIVLVLSGSRAFRIDGATVTVPAGHAALIPAGLLHAPLPMPDEETVCLNAYVPASRACSSLRVIGIGARWQRVGEISPEHILEIADDMLSRTPSPSAGLVNRSRLGAALTQSLEPIGAVAAGFGRSREGFSRMVRRELGVAPHAFRLLARLNLARQLLRAGEPIAAVAADAGFSDQSHLTRLFRRTFGTTPGVYWRD